MKKRIFALITAAIMMMSLLAACSDGPITEAKAQKIAMEHAGLSQKDVMDVHTHIVDENGIPCYSIHITTATEDFSVVINATTGEVIE